MEAALQRIIRKLELNENTVSTIIGGMVLVIVAVLFISYFKNPALQQTTPTQPSEEATVAEETPGSIGETSSAAISRYVVEPNETLWSIAEKEYGDGFMWTEIAKVNNITQPNQLEKGQELDIPRKSDVTAAQPAVAGTTDETPEEISTVEQVSEETTPTINQYTVQHGDSLWKIAEKIYSDGYRWVDIWHANQAAIANPNILPNGVVLEIPS